MSGEADFLVTPLRSKSKYIKGVVLTFRALALRQSDWRNCGLCVGLYAESGATLLVGTWWRENRNKLVEWKALVDTVGIKGADLEDKFLF